MRVVREEETVEGKPLAKVWLCEVCGRVDSKIYTYNLEEWKKAKKKE